MKTINLKKELNPEQYKAVTHTKGPLLIIAGAGTGKTKVITHRIAWLIREKLAKPEEILALTFTEKAAAEMEERVDVLVPYGYIDTWISTFHAFGDRILRENYLELGIDGSYELLSKSDQLIWLKNHLFEFPLDHFRPLSNPEKHIEALLTFISRCKDELISPDDLTAYAVKLKKDANNEDEKNEAKKLFELSQFYDYYQNLILEDGKFDFGDLIIKTIELFNKRPLILKEYQKKFKYILVDEFQDTNFAQNQLVKMLSRNNITVVGDDDQSIYKFRGASVSNIMEFKKNFKSFTQIVLTKNYRSSQEILDSSYKLIKNNNPDRLEIKNKINKKLLSNFHGIYPNVIYTGTNYDEIKSVVNKIIEKHETNKIDYSSIAILVRANNHLEPFIAELSKHKINYNFSGDRGLFEMPEIKLIICFITTLVKPIDNLAHYFLISSDFYSLDNWELNKLSSLAKQKNKYLIEIFENLDSYDDINISDKSKNVINSYVEDLKKYSSEIANLTGGQLVYKFLSDKKYLYKLLNSKNIQDEIKIKNISKLFKKIKSLEKYSTDKSLKMLFENIEDIEKYSYDKQDATDDDFDAVNLLTVHSAKGLEFDIVFMVSLTQDRFPTRKKKEPLELPEKLIKESLPSSDFHIQEERRLFYVGMTRAKKELYFSFANDYGGTRTKKPSIFISEALDKTRIELSTTSVTPIEEIEMFKLPFEDSKIKLKVSNMFVRGKLYLNPHKIDDYLTCPLKFKYLHILEIPVLKYHHVAYGQAIHEALKFYYDNKLKKNNISENELLKVFETNWDSEGFESRAHEEKRKEEGTKALLKYYAKAEKENIMPESVEKKFKFELNDTLIKGRFDIIYNQNDIIEISDFKTSDIDTLEKAQKRAKESNQLAIYALAWQKIEGKLPEFVSLNFINSNIVGKYAIKQKRLDKVIDDINKVKEGITKIDFSAKPNFNNCHYCAYKSICPSKFKGS